MSRLKSCPCGSGAGFIECCNPFISGKKLPQTAEALMRSRYSAFTRARTDYIAATQIGSGTSHFDACEVRVWAKSVKWLKLEIIEATLETVHFVAHFVEKGHPRSIEEKSEFVRINGKWFYQLKST